MKKTAGKERLLNQATHERWQEIVDLMAEVLDVPAGLVMRVDGPDIEVLVSSKSEENPYTPGNRELLENSGLYCETVIRTQSRLHVPNALRDPEWRDNPDIQLNMIAYLGFPVLQPDGKVFGTICVLDRKEMHLTPAQESLMLRLKDLLEAQLKLVQMNQELEETNASLRKSLEEVRTLRGIIPICCICHKIRDDKGYWEAVDLYVSRHTEADFTHSVCPDCLARHYPEYAEEISRTRDQES